MVVPNDNVSTVVMFIAPGPPNPASTDVLYVAATRSITGLPAYKVSTKMLLNNVIIDSEFNPRAFAKF